MPGQVRKKGDKWCVYWGGEKKGEHETKAKAKAQLRAIRANTSEKTKR